MDNERVLARLWLGGPTCCKRKQHRTEGGYDTENQQCSATIAGLPRRRSAERPHVAEQACEASNTDAGNAYVHDRCISPTRPATVAVATKQATVASRSATAFDMGANLVRCCTLVRSLRWRAV